MPESGGDIGHAGAEAVPVPPSPPHLVLGDGMADGPFSRVYYVDLEEHFRPIWEDDGALAVYVRLLSIAEAMWPAIPEVPRSARNATVKVLIDAGLIVPVPPYRYRIKGLDAARSARSIAARNAANIRHGNAPEMPNRTEPILTVPTSIARSAPQRSNGAILDERELTEEQQRERYLKAQAKQTGVES